MPTRIHPGRVEIRAEGEVRKIAGHAAVYYDGTPETEYWLWSDVVERVAPGAFDRAIREDDVRALFNHDPNLVLGRSKAQTLKLSVDAKGLAYEIDPPDTQAGRDALTVIGRGDVTGSSFSFAPRRIDWSEITDEKGQTVVVRTIVEVELYDVGPVTFPAYEGSTTGVRSRPSCPPDEMQILREEIAAWRRGRDEAAANERGTIARAARARALSLRERSR